MKSKPPAKIWILAITILLVVAGGIFAEFATVARRCLQMDLKSGRYRTVDSRLLGPDIVEVSESWVSSSLAPTGLLSSPPQWVEVSCESHTLLAKSDTTGRYKDAFLMMRGMGAWTEQFDQDAVLLLAKTWLTTLGDSPGNGPPGLKYAMALGDALAKEPFDRRLDSAWVRNVHAKLGIAD